MIVKKPELEGYTRGVESDKILMDGWISLAGPEVLRRKDGHGPRGIFLRTRMAVAVAESALLTYDMIDKDVELVLYLC